MSTNDVPGHNSANSDELRAGCWAEHEDGSLIYVYAVEADMVSYRIFDMTKTPPLEYLDRMDVKEFGELFSCNLQDVEKMLDAWQADQDATTAPENYSHWYRWGKG